MAETYKLDIDMLERSGTAACLAATRAMIARIRELEAELERASQPGSGEDTARLDWLQTHGCTVRRADNGKRNLVIWNKGPIRPAIDAARASLDGPREG
ncbi:hypothetical protein [Cupriavidus pauculus]|uniref:hypothetical protein n=1 Tax=Cupriavidus pauculus TaxID=82633 RepID=UPI0030F6F54A